MKFTPHKWIHLEIKGVHYVRPKNPHYVLHPTPADYSNWTSFERYAKNNTIEISGDFPVKEEYEFDEFEIFSNNKNEFIATYKSLQVHKKKEVPVTQESAAQPEPEPETENEDESNRAILDLILSSDHSVVETKPAHSTQQKTPASESFSSAKSILQEIFEIAKNSRNFHDFIEQLSEKRD